MDRREALALFGAAAVSAIPDISDPWKGHMRITRLELRKLIAEFDTAYPYAASSVAELPQHVHKLNKIVIALAEEIL